MKRDHSFNGASLSGRAVFLSRVLAAVLLCLLLFTRSDTVFSSAADNGMLVFDDADLLTQSEEEALEKKLEEIRGTYGTDVVAATSLSSGLLDAGTAAEKILVDNGFGQGSSDGAVILYVDTGSRSWIIRTMGSAIQAFTDAGQQYISEHFLQDLSEGNYNKAFSTFADLSGSFLKQAETGKPYDVDNMPARPFTVFHFLISLAVGFIVALIIVMIMKSNLKSVHFQSGAADYMQKNSFNLRRREDLFLYDRVTRVRKPQQNRGSGGGGGGSSTHSGYGGNTFGGSGGHF